MDTRQQSRLTAGLTLIVVGLLLFFLQQLEGFGDTAVLAALGAIFLVGYLWRRMYGLLVPAGILLGLAVGSFVHELAESEADWTLFGLGCGFFFIYLVDLLYERRRRWWPAVPGTILVLLAFPVTEDLFDLIFDHWPALLVLIGLVIAVGAFFQSKDPDRPAEPTGARPPEPPAPPVGGPEPEGTESGEGGIGPPRE